MSKAKGGRKREKRTEKEIRRNEESEEKAKGKLCEIEYLAGKFEVPHHAANSR